MRKLRHGDRNELGQITGFGSENLMRLQPYSQLQPHHLKDKSELLPKIFSWTTWNWRYFTIFDLQSVTFIWFKLIICASQNRLHGWDGVGECNRRDFNPIKAKAIFFNFYPLPWCGKSCGGKARTQEGNIWMEQGGSIFLWSYDILVNGASRVWDQKQLLFLSPYPPALSPPLFSLQHPVPIHLFRVWFKSSRDLEQSCYIVWNSPEILSGFHNVFIL